MWRPIAIALCLVALSAMSAAGEERLNASVLQQPLAISEFALLDQNDRAFTLERLKGHWSLLEIGYTSCPDICPFTLGNLAAVLDEFRKRPGHPPAPSVVFLAVDPARDRPVLKGWIEQFDPRFIGMTGSDAQIAILAHAVGAAYRVGKPDRQGRYDVAHSAAVSVIDPQGRVRARLLPPFPPAASAGFLAGLMQDSQPIAQADGAR